MAKQIQKRFISNDFGLNQRQVTFCDTYLSNGELLERAYISAYPEINQDYAGTSASKLLKRPGIKEYILHKKEKLAKKMEITKESLVNDLVKIKDAAIAEKSFSNATKAIEVLAKMLGHNEPDKVDVTTNGESMHQLTFIENKTYIDQREIPKLLE